MLVQLCFYNPEGIDQDVSKAEDIFRYINERTHNQKQYFRLCSTFYRVESDSRTERKRCKSNHVIHKWKEIKNKRAMGWFSRLLSASQLAWPYRMCNNKIARWGKSY